MNDHKKVHSIITTKSSFDWSYIVVKVKEEFNQDISDFLPVFLKIEDFNITHDPTFSANDIFSSWWQYKKMPVIILGQKNDLLKLKESQRSIIENIAFYIK